MKRLPRPRLLVEELEPRIVPVHLTLISYTAQGQATASGTYDTGTQTASSPIAFVAADGDFNYGYYQNTAGWGGYDFWDSGLFYWESATDIVTAKPYYEATIQAFVRVNPLAFGATRSATGTVQVDGQVTVRLDADTPAEANDVLKLAFTLNQDANAGTSAGCNFAAKSFSTSPGQTQHIEGSVDLAVGDSITISMTGTATASSSSPNDAALDTAEMNLFFWPTKPEPLSLRVTTPDSQQTAGPKFGPYLPGLTLEVPFTVSAIDPGHLIKRVRYSIDGGPSIPAHAGKGKWTFIVHAGTLSENSNHTLTVTAFDAGNNPLPNAFPGILDVEKLPLSYQLRVAYPGTSSQDPKNLRFVAATPLKAFDFTGVIGGLPSYYKHAQLRVALGSHDEKITSGGNLNFNFSINGADLPAGSSAVSVTLDKVPLENLSSQPLTPQQVLAVAEPDWLKDIKPVFKNGVYEFRNVRPGAVLSLPVAQVDTGIAALNKALAGLKTSATLTPDLDVFIPVMQDQTPTVQAKSLQAGATILGRTVWPYKSYGLSNVTGTLDTNTLAMNSMTVNLPAPVTLADRTFFNEEITIPFVAKDPLLHVSLAVGLELGGSLTANGGLTIESDADNQLELDPASTFLTLTATATPTVKLSLEVSLLSGWIKVKPTATASATLSLQGTAHFAGPVTAPEVSDTSLHAQLQGSFSYDFDALNKSKKQNNDEADQVKFGPVTLF